MSSEEEESESSQSRSPSPDIKSKAVVKYTSVKCPVSFSKLQCNTDLKMPPSNWLSSATDSYGLRHVLSHSTGFSSFKMAHMFPDCVGEVDVVSGAECIKSLLKLPYHPNGVISMMVHRVENTLLLDDFDIFQYLMKSEWSWMKKFFFEKSSNAEDKVVYLKNKSRYALQQKSLISKFLYYSLPSSKDNDINEDDDKKVQCPTLPLTGPNLPEPDIQKTVPYSSFADHIYNRNVVWTFENIQMLIGSDLPIFGGGDRPCVSLRLRDASEPINVLTGIDYWLDNLMCNVPEVIMCYHLDGIVRKYEPIKTEDLPNLKDSKFSPKVIRNVAQNILSFLKSNATKAGHTYWLFKGTHDDVVKLYDLTTLCGTVENSTDQNPFTIPVAMLLYRVARNMKVPCQTGHIKVLLENCIKLLPYEKFPHIIASSHFMLANLFIPNGIDPGSPNLKANPNGECECGDPKTCRRQEDYDEDENSQSPIYNKKRGSEKVFEGPGFSDSIGNQKISKESGNTDTTSKSGKLKNENKLTSGGVAVHSLTAPSTASSSRSAPPPITDNVETRCHLAIQHVYEGLKALKNFIASTTKKNKEEKENPVYCEENPKMANSFEPIPMGYETLNNENYTMANSNISIPMPGIKEEVDSEKESIISERHSRRRKKETKHKKKQEIQNKISESNKALLPKEKLPSWREPKSNDDASWKIHLKTLLYEKACLSYATLAEQYFIECQYGLSYKFTISAQKCRNILVSMLNNISLIDESILLSRAGDNLFQFAKHWDKFQSLYLKQIDSLSNIDKFIISEISEDAKIFAFSMDDHNETMIELKSPTDLEGAMVSSGELYSKALKIAPRKRKDELLRRIASVKNELGVKYMFNAQDEYAAYCNMSDAEKSKSKQPLYEIISKKSFQCFTEASKIFEQVKDLPNLALLHCNTGRFMRFRAHCNQENHSPEQKRLYSIAIDHYTRALRLLSEESCDGVRDLVKWELSSALFTQACLLQDSPPNSSDAASEAAEALRLALRNCPLIDGPKQCLYQFRAGLLYHRLGSLYHNQYRDSNSDQSKWKAAAAISKLNYELAVKQFLPLEDVPMFLTVQLEHIALLEYQANNSPGLKLKSLQTAFDLLQQCEPVLKIMIDKDSSTSSESFLSGDESPTEKLKNKNNTDYEHCEGKTSDDDAESDYKLLMLFKQRLEFILKSLIQLYMQKHGNIKKDCDKMLNFFKTAYSIVLKSEKLETKDIKLFASHLYEVMVKIRKHAKSNQITLS